MSSFLADGAPERAVDLYLEGLPNVQRQRLQPEYLEKLTEQARTIAQRLEGVLSETQSLADGSEEHRILLYQLLKQLPVVTFEPLNYAFVGRVVIPLENVLDLLINLDVYASGKPVRRGETPGVVELLSIPEAEEAEKASLGVIDIAGIGRAYSAILRDNADIRTTQDLLAKAGTPQGRAELAEQTGLSEKLLTRWVRRADLMRIEGVGEEYGELLDHAGVKSLADLARRNAANLYEKLRLTNAVRDLVRRLPSVQEIQNWIEQATTLA